ncbi:hypothetical protein [Vibrio crassostreae]|uniref:hypothetical protein n=1 Tax=Vibrio crassostreae TaxID=246167 RepID=UPI001B3006DC|nr:hypothetical protein [Vibrio crassostreae]
MNQYYSSAINIGVDLDGFLESYSVFEITGVQKYQTFFKKVRDKKLFEAMCGIYQTGKYLLVVKRELADGAAGALVQIANELELDSTVTSLSQRELEATPKDTIANLVLRTYVKSQTPTDLISRETYICDLDSYAQEDYAAKVMFFHDSADRSQAVLNINYCNLTLDNSTTKGEGDAERTDAETSFYKSGGFLLTSSPPFTKFRKRIPL